MSDTKSAQEQTTTEVSMMKTSLRTHFARLLDDELDVDEVTNWFASLGMVTGKQDITENAAALTHYFDDLGFNTGEDYCLAKEEDIEAACKSKHMESKISMASARTIYRYMTSRPDNDTASRATAGTANTVATGGTGSAVTAVMNDNAAKALMKIATSATEKVPRMQEKYMTVSLIRKHIKDYIRAKENEWEGNGLYDAITAMRSNMDKPYEDLVVIAGRYATDAVADRDECSDFLKSVSSEIQGQCGIGRSRSIIEAVARMLRKCSTKSFEECREDIRYVSESVWIIKSGHHLRKDFEDWVKKVFEVRYTPFISAETILESMMTMLVNFQPLVHKLIEAYKIHGDSQASIDNMIKVVREHIPKPESRSGALFRAGSRSNDTWDALGHHQRKNLRSS